MHILKTESWYASPPYCKKKKRKKKVWFK